MQPWQMDQKQFVSKDRGYLMAVHQLDKSYKKLIRSGRSRQSNRDLLEEIDLSVARKRNARERAIQKHRREVLKAVKKGHEVPRHILNLYFPRTCIPDRVQPQRPTLHTVNLRLARS